MLNFLEELRSRVVLFDGAMGTEIYRRGIFINQCYDELNLSKPNLIKEIHLEYKNAGADVIETNTFGANRIKLGKFLFADKVYDINYRGALIAREVAGDDILVAGSVGPLGLQIEPLGPTSIEEAIELFSEQIGALVKGGVNLIILETFIYLSELASAVKAARKICDLPIIAQLTIDEECKTLTGSSPEVIIKEMEKMEVDVIGANCTVGPQTMLNWLEKARKLTSKPISVMPNAGKPKSVEGRNIYLASPEYFGEYAKHFVLAGANVIGGCCGTTPQHIKKMRNTLNAIQPSIRKRKYYPVKGKLIAPVEPIPPQNKSRLARRLLNNHFVLFVELLSPLGVSIEKELAKARELNYFGVDVINIPDGPRASARMSALALAVQIQREVGIETCLHYVCRDRNVIGIQSDLLGAYSLGIRNILALTGDPPKLGNYPDATAVFDVDSIGLVNIINRINHGLDIAGNPIGKPSGFFIGVGANPTAINIEEELRRLYWKVDAGAEFIITQPVFDVELFKNFYERIKHYNIPLIAGIWPLTSLRNAEFLNNEVPGCFVPPSIMKRLEKVQGSKEESINEGVNIAIEILGEIRNLINGVQISPPFGRIDVVFRILENIK